MKERGDHVQKVEEEDTRYEIETVCTCSTDNQVAEDLISKDSRHSSREIGSEIGVFGVQCRQSLLNTLDSQPH